MLAKDRILFSITLIFVCFVGSAISIECYDGSPFLGNHGVKVTNCSESECYLFSFGRLHQMKCGYESDCRMSQFMNNLKYKADMVSMCCNESLCNVPESLRDQLERRLVRTTTTESTLLSDVQAIDNQIEQNNFHVEPAPKASGLWRGIWRFMNQAFDDVTVVYGRSPNRSPTYLSNWYYGRTGGGITHSKTSHKTQSSSRSGGSSNGWLNNHDRGFARTHSKTSSGSWWSSSSSRSGGSRSSSSRGGSRSRGGG
ncbi:hypothetical protein M3Y97_01120600 [Aphelenchoides bicaudatus]|nr:hypothetical protein M3Y97_01120600 [Aphelenchoides bicaudatus]